MGKGWTTLAGLGIGLVLFFALNILANATLRSWRLDLTEEKLFTLSEGSRNIARDVEETVRLKLFVTREPMEDLPDLKTYAQRVEEMLQEYALVSQGKVELEVIDPEPYSEAEEAAVEAGLFAASGFSGLERIYFGLVATNAVGDEELISFFDPREERFLEYEISRVIYTLDHPERTVVGVLSSLPLAGAPPNPMMPQAPQRWGVMDYIDSVFESRALQPGLSEIPEDVDVLLVAHPKDFPAETLFAIDQFVLGGGRAVILADAWCDNDVAGQDPSNPFAGMNADKASSLGDLLGAWGVELVPARVAADRENALLVNTMVQGAQEQWPMVVGIGLGEDNYDGDDAITSLLGTVNLWTAGILRALPEAGTTFQKLMWTSEDSMDLERGAVQFRPNPKELLEGFVPRKEAYTLAARVTGTARSAFDAPPGSEPETPEGEEGEEAPAPPAADHTTEGMIHLIVVSDADFLHERYWMQRTFFGPRAVADNGDFLINAIENLSGSDDLIAIRGRGELARPFDRVEEIRREAEEKYLNEEKLLNQKLKDAEDRINELIQQENPGSLILTPEVEEAIEAARDEMVDTNRQLREVRFNLRKDIERLGTRLKWLNIGLVPALVCMTAVVLSVTRKRRKQG